MDQQPSEHLVAMVERRVLDLDDLLRRRIEVLNVRVEHAERQHGADREPARQPELASDAGLAIEDRLIVLDDCRGAIGQDLVRRVRRSREARDRREVERQTSGLDVAGLCPPDREVRIASTTSSAGECLRHRACEQRDEDRDRDVGRGHAHV